jgi:hypothetical protein
VFPAKYEPTFIHYLEEIVTYSQETNPSSRHERCYITTVTARDHLQNKISGRDPQGTWNQDELVGGKPSVVK